MAGQPKKRARKEAIAKAALESPIVSQSLKDQAAAELAAMAAKAKKHKPTYIPPPSALTASVTCTEDEKDRLEAIATEERKARRTGRPSMFKPEYCEVVEDLGEMGLTPVEMAVKIGVLKSTLKKWALDFEIFAESFARAREASEAYHAEKYRLGCNLPAQLFNAAAYRSFMAAVFEDWREISRQELTGKDGAPLMDRTEEQVDARLAYLLGKSRASGSSGTEGPEDKRELN